MSVAAGSMAARVRFERRATADDGYGNSVGGWATVIERPCGIRPDFGVEGVDAGALAATSRAIITVHRSAAVAAIAAADRAVITGGPWRGTSWQIRSILPRPDSASVEFKCEQGVAV